MFWRKEIAFEGVHVRTGRWLGKGASQRRPANEGINKRLAKAADKEGQKNNPRPRSIIDEVREIAMPG
jgi:hypothetical protein